MDAAIISTTSLEPPSPSPSLTLFSTSFPASFCVQNTQRRYSGCAAVLWRCGTLDVAGIWRSRNDAQHYNEHDEHAHSMTSTAISTPATILLSFALSLNLFPSQSLSLSISFPLNLSISIFASISLSNLYFLISRDEAER
jgi:hypothetical protein